MMKLRKQTMVFMIFADDDRIPIRRVDGPGEAWLQLRGSILLFHKQNFVSSSTSFIPVEWIRVSEERRRDLRHLWHGLLGLTVAVLFALPLWVLVFRMRPHLGYDPWIAFALVIFLLVTLGIAAWAMGAFLRPRPLVTLFVEGTPSCSAIRFWRDVDTDGPVAALMESLNQARQAVTDSGLPPVRMTHLFRRPRTYRIALIKGLGISFLFYVLLLFMDAARVAGYGPDFSRLNYVFLALPPLGYLGTALLRRAWMLREPRSFREALWCYEKQRLTEAAAHLESLLALYPGHDSGRFLMVRVLAEQFDVEQALAHCEALSKGHPLLAAHLQSNLWGIRRMHARMGGSDCASGR